MAPSNGSETTYKSYYITTIAQSTLYFSNHISQYYTYVIATNLNYSTNKQIYTNIFLGLQLVSNISDYLTNYSQKTGDITTTLKYIKTNIVLKDEEGTIYINTNITNVEKDEILTNVETNISYITNTEVTNYLFITNFSGMDLNGFDFSYLNLAHFNLSRANLSNVNFTGANLFGAHLGASKTNGANFSNANLKKVTFVSFSNLTNVLYGDNSRLNNVKYLAKTTLNETNYLFVSDYRDNSISMFLINDNGHFLKINHLLDNEQWNMRGASSMATLAVNDGVYLFVGGEKDNGFSAFSISNDETLFNITNLDDNRDLKFKGISSIYPFEVGDSNYLLILGKKDDGFSVFSISDLGQLINVTNVKDEKDLQLAGANAAKSVIIKGTTYLFVTGEKDHGFSVFSMGDRGFIKNLTNVHDTGDLKLKSPSSVSIISLLEKAYVFITSAKNNGMSVFSMNEKGLMENITNIKDDHHLNLKGAKMIIPAIIKNDVYLFGVGTKDNGVSVFSMLDDKLTWSGALSDYHSLNLKGITSMIITPVRDKTLLLVAGEKERGISVFEVEPSSP